MKRGSARWRNWQMLPVHVIDVGCGGGTYTRAWHDLGAASVTGLDFSAPILGAAHQAHGHPPGTRFLLGDAAGTGLLAQSADIVFARALVHHVKDLDAVVREAHRLLRPRGFYIVQDRMPEDVTQPGSATHPRGWLFDLCPSLLEVELARRPRAEVMDAVLEKAKFTDRSVRIVWETRRHYRDREEYLAEIRTRKGRSILHSLTDDDVATLVDRLRSRLPEEGVTETDRWTLWRAVAA